MTIKKYTRKVQSGILAGLCLLLIHSCAKKDWDEHYAVPEYLNAGGILDVLAKDAAYTEFRALLKKTGYDSLLNRTSLYTVLAIKNGAFAGIDTSSNTPLLQRIIGMHIFPTAIYAQQMNNAYIRSVSGKNVYFSLSGTDYMADGRKIAGAGTKTRNGQIYGLDQAILPKSNLAELIAGNPAASIYGEYLLNSFSNVPDPLKNTVIGTDAAMKPIYRAPIVYKPFSSYLNDLRIDDEQTLSTVFVPTDAVIGTQLAKLLTAREGRTDLLVPKLGTAHGDTTIGYYFVPRGLAYPGDSAILKNYLFNQVVVAGDIPRLNAGNNTFTNKAGSQLVIGSDQVQGTAVAASNGSAYVLNAIALPETAYRSKFMFQPSLKNPAPATTYALNPGVTFSGGAVYGSDVVSNYQNTYRGRASRFNFTNIGAVINFNMPYVTKGRYKVLLKNYLDNNGCIVNASYGSQLLRQNINASTQYALSEISTDVPLGVIDVAATGAVRITFTCANVSPKAAGQYLFTVDMLILEPTTAP